MLHNVVADHEAKEKLIKQSRLKWTIVRPPRLTNGRRTGAYRIGERIRAKSIFPAISRADVADFMLKQLTDDTYLHKAPGVIVLMERVLVDAKYGSRICVPILFVSRRHRRWQRAIVNDAAATKAAIVRTWFHAVQLLR